MNNALAILLSFILVFGGINLIQSLAGGSPERPKPYDVARNEVYATFLRGIDLEGDKALLVQEDNNTSGIEYMNESGRLGLDPVDVKLQHDANEAIIDVAARQAELLAIEKSVAPKGKHMRLISSQSVESLLKNGRSNGRSDVCETVKGRQTLVVVSAVGFNSTQTLAGFKALVIHNICHRDNILTGGWAGVRMFHKVRGEWVEVESAVFSDVAIG